ncbi:MAG: GxxExxY protein [Candidatus Binatia bacterium]
MTELLHAELTFETIGAAMEVHRSLGPGFLESVYHRGMECELRHRGVMFESQVRIGVSYKGVKIGEHVLDLVVNRSVIVELKAAKEMNELHQAQLISYLKAARLPVGLLINFSKASLDYKRILLKDSLRL